VATKARLGVVRSEMYPEQMVHGVTPQIGVSDRREYRILVHQWLSRLKESVRIPMSTVQMPTAPAI
jgi:hypothetical protein